MKRTLLIIAIAVLAILSYAGYTFAAPRLWIQLDKASVSSDGVKLSDSGVYRSPKGELLLRVSGSDYLFFPATKELGIPNSDQFLFLFGSAFCKEDHAPVVVFSDNRVKVENDMLLLVEESRIEFTTLEGIRATVELPAH